ncbi:MAG: ArsI/CadI family heavy metal resistance metalloenzyme [Pseudomonadota bacterium]
MARMHIHVGVDDIENNVTFYTTLFGAAPDQQEADYAKWMLDDPKVNFAISARARQHGVDHLGIQVETEEELDALRARLDAANVEQWHEGKVQCCYAASDKSWAQDPNGVAWEAFTSMARVATYYGDDAPTQVPARCGTSAESA